MTDLLERTHHEPLVVMRLTGITPRPRTPWRRRHTLAAVLAMALVGVVTYVVLDGGDPVDDAPAPVLTLPAE